MKLREMGSKNCMNEVCRATASSEWKKGWSLKSGGFATLCSKCGSAYENSIFCENFHLEESGWRECRICGKRIHCGCIASRYLHEYMDFGGVGCISCAKRLEIHFVQPMPIPVDIPNGAFVSNSVRDVHPIAIEPRVNDDKLNTERLLQLTKSIRVNDVNSPFEQLKRDETVLKTGENGKHVIQNITRQSSLSPAFVKSDNIRQKQGAKDMFESLSQPSLNFSLTTPVSEQSKSSFEQGQRSQTIFQKPPKPSPVSAPETNKGASVSQTRVARPPAEGRGRNQLLPRYWPRITDQELQQLSGDLKSTIVPLFEKILSASDAGRIGRLVLPKACAEAYFPTINQSEGIPIRIQDIKGKEWTFQFRFWPNNNSRMYVLEGVTPCIHNMQLQAGDTVTFSRIDPGGQLVIGCRKASNNDNVQDLQVAAVPNGDSPGETSFSGVTDNPLSGGRISEDSLQQHMTMSDKKKAKNIKNKRHFMHNDDAMELRITWEDAQELFRPSPSAEPTVVMVDDYEFEEFEEPPILGKRTIFISRPSGEQEQLAQCDSCGKWRRLPLNALLSANWTCSDNTWDSNRCSCSAPEDVNPRDLESFYSMNKDFKRRRISDSKASKEGDPPSGLDALATAAVLGDNIPDIGEPSMGPTTRHPRHRPGCTCIVCIQPPSGKGKHEPTCKCNVCLTVKRRFKTLMMRKKKRQSDREAELAQEKGNKIDGPTKIDFEMEDIAGHALLNMNRREENEINENNENADEANKGVLDLNCDPHREDDVNATSFPLDMHLGGQNGHSGSGQENGADGGSKTDPKNNNEEG